MDEIKKEPIGVVVACKRFFGFKEGQSMTQFAAEMQKLTQQDKEEFAILLSKELGEPVVMKTVVK